MLNKIFFAMSNPAMAKIIFVITNIACGEMKPLRVMSIHKSVCVTSFNDVLTEVRGNIYADSTLISCVIWSPLSSVSWHLISDCISFFFFFCVFEFSFKSHI